MNFLWDYIKSINSSERVIVYSKTLSNLADHLTFDRSLIEYFEKSEVKRSVIIGALENLEDSLMKTFFVNDRIYDIRRLRSNL